MRWRRYVACEVFDEISGAAATPTVDIDDFIEGCMWIKRSTSAIDILTIDAGVRMSLRELIKLKSPGGRTECSQKVRLVLKTFRKKRAAQGHPAGQRAPSG